jgi:hypothetical protein
MKTGRIFGTLFIVLLGTTVLAQDEWEKVTHFTGYVNAVAEYSDSKNLKKDYAVGVSEIGFLATYKPSRNLEFKSTLVYSHYTFHVSQLFVEGYGMYHFNDGLKFGVGRFLTPLSPVNLYFYAPLNPSGVVPMLVSHHFLFPQSISGFQLGGNFEPSANFKWGYNLSAGTYQYINHFESGVLSILSQEDSYPSFGYYDTEADKINNYLSATARLHITLNNKFTVGANYFTGDAQQVTQSEGRFIYYPSTKYTWGIDGHLTLSNLKVNAEYWAGRQQTTPETDDIIGHIENSYEAYYAEAIYDGDVFKPFFRYDYIKDITVNGVGLPTKAATIGIAVRPLFETLLKLEYKRILAREITDIGNQVYNNYNYNYMQMSFVLSF